MQADRARSFDPETGVLELDLHLPPTANKLARHNRFGVHPTPEYAAWLGENADHLRTILGDWQPDTHQWWEVWIDLHLGTAGGDGDNRSKAVLDLLAGAYVTTKGELGTDGLPVSAGLVQRRGALFNDDCRQRKTTARVMRINSTDPHVRIYAKPCEPPTDEREERREAKELEREQALALKAAEKQAAIDEKARQKAQEAQERLQRDREAIQALRAKGVTDRLPGAIVADVAEQLYLPVSRVRAAWRNREEVLAITASVGRQAGVGGEEVGR